MFSATSDSAQGANVEFFFLVEFGWTGFFLRHDQVPATSEATHVGFGYASEEKEGVYR